MRRRRRAQAAMGVLVLCLGIAARASADETDNFTCRTHPLLDSLSMLDALMNARIHDAVDRANSAAGTCDRACLVRELRKSIGAKWRHPLTGIPHAETRRSGRYGSPGVAE